MPFWMLGAWTYQNFHGARQYRKVEEKQRFNWQQAGWEQLEPATAPLD